MEQNTTVHCQFCPRKLPTLDELRSHILYDCPAFIDDDDTVAESANAPSAGPSTTTAATTSDSTLAAVDEPSTFDSTLAVAGPSATITTTFDSTLAVASQSATITTTFDSTLKVAGPSATVTNIFHSTLAEPPSISTPTAVAGPSTSTPTAVAGPSTSTPTNKPSKKKQHILKIQCPFCRNKLSSFKFLHRHVSKYHPNRNLISSSTTTKEEDELPPTKIQKTKKFPCPDCGSEFTSNKYLENHFYKFHHLQQQQPSTSFSTSLEKKKKPYSCPYCLGTYSTKQSLDTHVSITHARKEEDEAAATVEFRCPYCGTVLSTKESLSTHASKFHPKEETDRRRREEEENNAQQQQYHHYFERRSKESNIIWAKFLSEKKLHSLDGERPATPQEVKKIYLTYLLSEEAHADWRSTYHLVLPPGGTEILRKSGMFVKILPFTCRCFHNLLPNVKNAQEAQKFWNAELKEPEKLWKPLTYHEHSMGVAKNPKMPNSTRQRIASKQLGTEGLGSGHRIYSMFRIKDYTHFVNSVLYIAGRVSDHTLRTHYSHDMLHYLLESQKKMLRRQTISKCECTPIVILI